MTQQEIIDNVFGPICDQLKAACKEHGAKLVLGVSLDDDDRFVCREVVIATDGDMPESHYLSSRLIKGDRE